MMDNAMSKSELTATVARQNEQLKRYECRLRDVVTAYKGLMREKEALESSLTAIKSTDAPADDDDEGGDSMAKLAQSMATLTAEKARMEETYQNDRKLLKDQVCELQEQLQNFSKQKHVEVENIKAKLVFEIQEREREHTEHSLMIKELQMKLTSERRSKEKLEDKFIITSDFSNRDMEKKVRDLNDELEATQRKLNRAEARSMETPQMLIQLQEEISQMKQHHTTALRDEKSKAKKAEETAKKLCASQEERIAALEAKLAELSTTVGEYDRQRRRDQEIIQHFKDNISTKYQEDKPIQKNQTLEMYSEENESIEPPNVKLSPNMANLEQIIDKIHTLKKELIVVNENMGSPIDMWSIFNMTGSNLQNIHSPCQAEISALKTECNLYKKQVSQYSTFKADTLHSERDNQNERDQLRSHIKTLQDKVEILNQQLDEIEKEYETKLKLMDEKHATRESTHKEEIIGFKNKIHGLEEQLQNQRDRYATLLNERECEIKARHEKEFDSVQDKILRLDFNASVQDTAAPPHMLHYIQELARKDLEISGLRKEKHQLEGQLRDNHRETAIEKDRFKEVLRNLKEEIDRLRRIQSREGANLEYLKNVVLSYLLTTDPYSKKHMLNAIAAVLHFTDGEKECAYKVIS